MEEGNTGLPDFSYTNNNIEQIKKIEEKKENLENKNNVKEDSKENIEIKNKKYLEPKFIINSILILLSIISFVAVGLSISNNLNNLNNNIDMGQTDNNVLNKYNNTIYNSNQFKINNSITINVSDEFIKYLKEELNLTK